MLEQTELRARLKQVEEDLGAAVGREEYLEAAHLQAELAPLREQERLLSKLVKKQARLAELTGELDAALELAGRIKARKAVEARANAKNELHKAMFAVADILGGAYSQLRDPSGDVRFEAKDLIFGRPEQVPACACMPICPLILLHRPLVPV